MALSGTDLGPGKYICRDGTIEEIRQFNGLGVHLLAGEEYGFYYDNFSPSGNMVEPGSLTENPKDLMEKAQ